MLEELVLHGDGIMDHHEFPDLFPHFTSIALRQRQAFNMQSDAGYVENIYEKVCRTSMKHDLDWSKGQRSCGVKHG